MGSRRQLASIVRCSCGGEMPPVVRGGSSAQQTSSPVVSTSMSAQSSGVTMSCADSSRATPSHARYRARRQRAGDQHRAVVPRARASAAAPPPPAAARPLPPSHRVAHRRPLRAQRCRSPQRCRSRRLTETVRQLALRYRRPPPTLGHYRGRAERRARRCGAGSGFYSASGTISPLYSRSSRLLNNIYCPGITPGLALLLSFTHLSARASALSLCCLAAR